MSQKSDEDAGVGLADFVRGLRHELSEAQAEGSDKDLKFTVGPIELELSVAVTTEGGGGAKVRFWVVEGDAAARWAKETVQRVRVRLDPVDTSQPGRPQDMLVNDQVARRPA